MVSKKTTVVNADGFHMRVAGDFVNEMAKFKSSITIFSAGKTVNGKSIMRLMAAALKRGAELEIKCEGEDEEAQLEKACEMIESGFGEV